MDTQDRKRFVAALDFAAFHHSGQKRKGKQTPYVSHPISVAGIVLENGGDIDQAMAALLHDVLEDCDDVSRDDIAERFGEEITAIVEDCTDTLPGDSAKSKSPWKTRKDRYLKHLESVSERSILVAAADKRHNLGSMVADLREQGVQSLERFHASPAQQRWYFSEVLRIGGSRIPTRLQLELRELLAEFSRLAGLADT